MNKRYKLILVIILVYSQQINSNYLLAQGYRKDSFFVLSDSLDRMYNATPLKINSIYKLSKEIKFRADAYQDRQNVLLASIYTRCADCFRTHCSQYCGANESSLLCCIESADIVDCYMQSIRIYRNIHDTLSDDFLDAIYQLADVYEELKRPVAALPLRKRYLQVIRMEKGEFSNQTADAYMFLGGTYERLKRFHLANEAYTIEIRIRERDKDKNLDMMKARVETFRNKHHLSE